MIRVYVGALMVVGGIAAFIEAHSNQPVAAVASSCISLRQALAIDRPRCTKPEAASGLSPTGYDLVRIGGWALLVLGVLTIVIGLIRYARQPSLASEHP